jgi:hypothetical protein
LKTVRTEISDDFVAKAAAVSAETLPEFSSRLRLLERAREVDPSSGKAAAAVAQTVSAIRNISVGMNGTLPTSKETNNAKIALSRYGLVPIFETNS